MTEAQTYIVTLPPDGPPVLRVIAGDVYPDICGGLEDAMAMWDPGADAARCAACQQIRGPRRDRRGLRCDVHAGEQARSDELRALLRALIHAQAAARRAGALPLARVPGAGA